MSRDDAAERLLEHREALARAVTAALYEARPELLEKYGEHGRAKCLQDMRYNIEHLAPAVALSRPVMFADYITWVDGLLTARGVPTDELRESVVLLQREAAQYLTAEQQRELAACIDAGLAVLNGAGA